MALSNRNSWIVVVALLCAACASVQSSYVEEPELLKVLQWREPSTQEIRLWLDRGLATPYHMIRLRRTDRGVVAEMVKYWGRREEHYRKPFFDGAQTFQQRYESGCPDLRKTSRIVVCVQSLSPAEAKELWERISALDAWTLKEVPLPEDGSIITVTADGEGLTIETFEHGESRRPRFALTEADSSYDPRAAAIAKLLDNVLDRHNMGF